MSARIYTDVILFWGFLFSFRNVEHLFMPQFYPDLNLNTPFYFICLIGPTESENVTEEPFHVWECDRECIISIFKTLKFL